MKTINIINLTPHNIRLINEDGSFEDIISSGLARCCEEKRLVNVVDNIPVYKLFYGDIYGLPEPKENTIYIVSYIVLRACNNTRQDVYTVTDTVRDNDGRIIGFKGLSQL